MATTVASQLAKLRKEREALEKREKALMARTHDKALASARVREVQEQIQAQHGDKAVDAPADPS